ncbi:MAG: hypothetical protein H6741_03525 [Alphaproteobacteria bacterium]|nr:hypothetical protein [Alphaproteobacteria bacterium]MCB9791775.1 hypothetical protein [Alphaproteobacteria bacterium]
MDTYPVQVHVRVRARDSDADGALDTSALVVYLAEARRAYLGVLNLPPMRARVASMGLEVLALAVTGDSLAVRARVRELGDRGFTMEYLIRDRLSRQVIAQAWTTLVHLDEDDHLAPLPGLLRRRVAELEGRSYPLPA